MTFKGYLGISKLEKLVNKLLMSLSHTSDFYWSYHLRPKSMISKATFVNSYLQPKIAIVLQGPIQEKDGFTLESVKYYLSTMPGYIVIVSTWVGIDPDLVKALQDAGAEIVQNELPEFFGESNINLQLITTQAGINRAKELDCEYVLKSRTDQRFLQPSFIPAMLVNLEKYPLERYCESQIGRLVILSMNTYKYRLYGASDMFMFGHVQDMILYWSASLDNRKFQELDRQNAQKSLGAYSKWRVSEVYLLTEYLGKLNIPLEWSLTQSYRIFRELFYVANTIDADIIWHKYNAREYNRLTYDLNDELMSELSHIDWLLIYRNVNLIDESVLDKPLSDRN